MRNRIISLLLLASMLMSFFLTSCSDMEGDYEEDTSEIPAITLTLYGIKEEGTTDDAIALVEAGINRITQDKYKTTVKLNLLTEEEYADTIEDAFVSIDEQEERAELAEKAATAAAKAARLAAKELDVELQKEKKRAQREYEKWNEARGDSSDEVSITMSDDVQLDIFLVDDYAYYLDLIDRERITDISSPITSTYSIITKYVNPLTLAVTKYMGSYYGVPANRKLDAEKNEGYYYALRTDLVEKYGLNVPTDTPATLNSLESWFEQIKANERCTVLLAPPKAIQSFDFYNNDMDSYPAYGAYNVEKKITNSKELEFTFDIGSSMTSGTAYLHFNRMSKYRNLGYFGKDGADPKTTNFAAGIFQGTLDEVKEILGDKADEYTYCIYTYPKITTEDAFASTFVVSSSCKYPSRAVQLISGFCTNEQLRNLITYGVENVHYELNSDGETITKLTNDYNIEFERFGNSLIGYVPEELGADYQKNAIERNMGIKASAFIGFTEPVDEEDQYAFEQINAIASEYIYKLMNGATNIGELIEEATTRMGKYEDVLGLYPPVKDDEFFEPTYNSLLASLNGTFSNFAGMRPGGTGEIDNSVITNEEKKRREEAALLESETDTSEVEGEETAE